MLIEKGSGKIGQKGFKFPQHMRFAGLPVGWLVCLGLVHFLLAPSWLLMLSKSLEKVLAGHKHDFWIHEFNFNTKCQVLLGTSLKSRSVSKHMFSRLGSELFRRLIQAQEVLEKESCFLQSHSAALSVS